MLARHRHINCRTVAWAIPYPVFVIQFNSVKGGNGVKSLHYTYPCCIIPYCLAFFHYHVNCVGHLTEFDIFDMLDGATDFYLISLFASFDIY